MMSLSRNRGGALGMRGQFTDPDSSFLVPSSQHMLTLQRLSQSLEHEPLGLSSK